MVIILIALFPLVKGLEDRRPMTEATSIIELFNPSFTSNSLELNKLHT
ncbi:hypothetical protein LV84_03071 [Algoriphagus ratkowskyi]|uniref:Uncharacterized protein n=1 Tax=Algoriphagus ratkowskyi TaxID=57028 RepID=A0A2W7QZI7_9BACT|nr:hypothetical protein LV84_03071 [Algoriphagus ratkowskyi]